MPRDYNKRSFPPERKDDISSVRFQTMLGMATKGFPLNIAMAAVMGIFNLRSTQIRTDLRKNVQKYFSNKHQISVRKIRSIDSVEKLSEIPVEDNMTAQVVESIRQYVGAHGSCYLVECKGQHQYFLFRTDQDGKNPKGVKTVFGFLEGHMNQYNQLVAGSEATISRKGSWNASEVEPKIEQAGNFMIACKV